MIRQPSLLVIGYVVGVIVACAALASLTKVSLDMEASDLESRQEAALEENVRLALWRIDSDLAALIGRESSWPYYAYSSAYSVGGTTVDSATPPQARITSPLADFNGNWVVARFQIAPDGTVTSPQAGKTVLVDDDVRTVESLLEELKNPDVRSTLSAALPDPDVPTLEAVSRVTRTLKSRRSEPTTTASKGDPTVQVQRNSAEFDTRLRFYSGSTVPVARFEATRNLIQGFVNNWSGALSSGRLSSLWSPPAAQLELRSTPLLSSMSAAQADGTTTYGPVQGDDSQPRLNGVYGAGDLQQTATGNVEGNPGIYSLQPNSDARTMGVSNYAPAGGNLTLNNGTLVKTPNGSFVVGNNTLTTNIDGQTVQILVAPSTNAYNSRQATLNVNGGNFGGGNLGGVPIPQVIANSQVLPTSQGSPISQIFSTTGNVNSGQLVLNSANPDYNQQSNPFARNAAATEGSNFLLNSNSIEELRTNWNSNSLTSLQNGVIVAQNAVVSQMAVPQSAAPQINVSQFNVQQGAGNSTFVNVGAGNLVPNANTQQGTLVVNGNAQPQAADPSYGIFANGLPPQLRSSSQFDLANPQGQRLFNDNNLSLQTEVVKVSSMTGVMAPVWSGGALWLARKVDIDGMPYLQGCRLDWRGLQRYLQGLTVDLLPEVRFEAIVGETTVDAGRLLASIPARIVPGQLAGGGVKIRMSSMRTTLAWAWGGLLTAAAAVGLMLWKVTSLSERRASFVSSVTHELRTPLTTFRLYGEMLASNMVTEPQQRQEYLETMCAESERLSHLVENVLAYSRLERGHVRANVAEFTPAELIARGQSRLQRRAEQAGMTFDVVIAEGAQNARLRTDSSAVEQILFNLVDNAGKYAVGQKTRELELFAEADARHVMIGVRDNGPGIGRAERKRLFQPFSKGAREAAESAPGVGLGLALCRRLARELGGDLRYLPGDVGATFVLALPRCDGKG